MYSCRNTAQKLSHEITKPISDIAREVLFHQHYTYSQLESFQTQSPLLIILQTVKSVLPPSTLVKVGGFISWNLARTQLHIIYLSSQVLHLNLGLPRPTVQRNTRSSCVLTLIIIQSSRLTHYLPTSSNSPPRQHLRDAQRHYTGHPLAMSRYDVYITRTLNAYGAPPGDAPLEPADLPENLQCTSSTNIKLNPIGAFQLCEGWELPIGPHDDINLVAGSRGYGSRLTPHHIIQKQLTDFTKYLNSKFTAEKDYTHTVPPALGQQLRASKSRKKPQESYKSV
ncbi:inactive serine/threonine-protein kinase-like [Dorcoceras hygrometricum]|uniref:Inactive serine/threonine-protein kinase-like n=1 Tax=Dorcoceras hygrometricum TaxID=472368 RepID=A0A2Z7B3X3_9LAMI|nr:inactive serine/threonine-protein kinase-like [Dorcoceras hygrometricum]